MKLVSPVDVFDFESGQWSSIAAPEPRLFAEMAELGGKLYLAGGYVGNARRGTSSRRNRSRFTTRRPARGRRSSTRCPCREET